MLATPQAARTLSSAARSRRISLKERVIKEGERLDSIAGEELGDARMWWIIAACSGIGWGLQIPPGTVLLIPSNMAEIRSITG